MNQLAQAGQYDLIFDLAQSGFRQGSFGAIGIALTAAGLVIGAISSRRAFKRARLLRMGLGWLPFCVALAWTIGVARTTQSEYANLLRATQTGQVQYVEGAVEHFVPMPYEGHASEQFEVQGKRFYYSDFIATSGFNNTSSHGGPIRPGLKVRVGYVGGTIVRLEVQRQ